MSESGSAPASMSEVIKCMGLGMRDGMRPGLSLMSVFAAIVAFGIWLIVFLVWRAEIWDLAEAMTKWAVAHGLALIGLSDAWAGGTAAIVQILNFILVAGAFLLLVMLSIRFYLELFLMRRVQQQCLKRYPTLAKGVQGSLRADLQSTLAQLAILCAGFLLLVIPLFGGIAFFFLGSYLNVRGLVNDALEDLATVDERRAIVKMIRVPMFLLGLLMTALLLVPFAGLLIPTILGASVCHLCMRALARMRSPSGGEAVAHAAEGAPH